MLQRHVRVTGSPRVSRRPRAPISRRAEPCAPCTAEALSRWETPKVTAVVGGPAWCSRTTTDLEARVVTYTPFTCICRGVARLARLATSLPAGHAPALGAYFFPRHASATPETPLTQSSLPSPTQVVVIDGRGHLLGRLASIVAKQVLNGQHVVRVVTQSNASVERAPNTRPRLGFSHPEKRPSYWDKISFSRPHVAGDLTGT